MNWICKVFGHDFDQEAAIYYSVYHCDRCGSNDGWEARALAHFRWRIQLAARDAWHSFKCWLRCPDCKKLFGRHDDSSDHIPF